MWTALTLVVLAASSPASAPTAEVTPGTKVRLSAGPAVDVPGLYSSDGEQTRFSGTFREAEGLLFFTRADGSEEAVLAPEGTVVAAFIASEGPWIEVLREGQDVPDRLRRASVARVEVATGRQEHRGALKGLGIGAGAGAGLGLVMVGAYSGGDGDAMATTRGMAISAVLLGSAVGLGLGALDDAFREEVWQEVPLESLGGPVGIERPPPPMSGPSSAVAEIEGRGSWTLVSVGSGGDIAIGLVRTGPLKRAAAALGRPEGAEASEGRED